MESVKNQQDIIASLLDKFKVKLSKAQNTRVKSLFIVISSIVVKETVNLNKVKNQIGTITGKTATQSNSSYRRLTRFFDDKFCMYVLWKWILQAVVSELIGRLDQRKGGRYLLMDATCWQLGKAKFHFLVLSVVFQGVSVPFFFVNLAKKGSSSERERIRLLQMANLLYPLRGLTLIADREYVGRQWFVDLVEVLGLNFVIRLSETDYKKEFVQQHAHYQQTLRKIRRGKTVDVPLSILGRRFRFVGTRNQKAENPQDDLLLLLTNLGSDKQKVIGIYSLRWQIECMFKCLKTNGFDLESMSLRNPAKVRLLVCVVIACYALCVCEGIKHLKKIAVRKKTQTRYESIFRRGYSVLCQRCQTVALFLDWMMANFGRPIRYAPT